MTSKLVAIVYPDMNRAEDVYETLKMLQGEYLIDLEDVSYVVKDAKGKMKLHQSVNLTGEGAAGGTIWGMLIGMLFFAPFAGALIGAGTGALAGAMSDYGIDDKFAKSLGKEMTPNSSAIFMLVRSATTDKVVPEISKFGGKILKTSLAEDAEMRLQKALEKGNREQMRTMQAHA
jgi:uncharacterized membrane protein